MNMGLRWIFGIYALLTFLLSLGIILMLTEVYDSVAYVLEFPKNGSFFIVVISLVSFLALVSLILFFSSFKSSPSTRKDLNIDTSLGEISISKKSIESMAYNIAKKFDGILSLEVGADIFSKAEKIKLTVKFSVFKNSAVQQTAKEMQQRLKDDLERMLEVQVSEVQIYVIDLEGKTSKKQRVV